MSTYSPRTRPRPRTLNHRRDLRREVREAQVDGETVEDFGPRPATRGECEGTERPCPWVGCQYHLYLDVNPDTGSIQLNFPDLEPWELQETCALDVAGRDEEGVTLDAIGALINVSRERVRQIELRGLALLRPVAGRAVER